MHKILPSAFRDVNNFYIIHNCNLTHCGLLVPYGVTELRHDCLWRKVMTTSHSWTIAEPPHKSHNASVPYPTIHQFVAEMCTMWAHFCYKMVHCGRDLSDALQDLWDGFIGSSEIPQKVFKISITTRCLIITHLRFQPHLPGANELIHLCYTHVSMRDSLMSVAIALGWASPSLNTFSITDSSVAVVSSPQKAIQSFTTIPAPKTSLPRFTVPA